MNNTSSTDTDGTSLEPISPLFAIGDLVSLRSNAAVIMPILTVSESASGEHRYTVFQNNIKSSYYESQLQAFADTSNNYSTLSVSELHAYLTSQYILSPSNSHLFSLHSGRVKFIPYQYRPVLKLIRADRPRLLIADEVGVGKTIEAGLIIKELRARMDLNSILIICPRPLVSERKWYLEMKRFEEDFTALDGSLLAHCIKETHLEGEWPEKYAKAILPFSLFDEKLLYGNLGQQKQKGHGLIALDPPPKFDLVIVDEAHHIRNSATYLHQGVKYFCDNADAVIFLSATPVQLGSDDLFTLLNVLRPDLIIDKASFEQMAEPNPFINQAIYQCRLGANDWQKEALTFLDKTAQTAWGSLFIKNTPSFEKAYDQLQNETLSPSHRVELTNTLEELYTFSSLINRTRRRDIGEFTTRKPETVSIDFTEPQRELHDELLRIIETILRVCHHSQNVKFMMTTIRRQAASCLYGLAPLLEHILLKKLEDFEINEVADRDFDNNFDFVDNIKADITNLLNAAKELDTHDPKLNAFVTLIQDKQNRENNKILLFSTFRHTLAYLAKNISHLNVRYGVIHGGVADDERYNLRQRFALTKEHPDAIDLILSSEVGCEGLDFQFCDLLVNYDLPWNPMRIEQRIGRIDRYGQKSETVAIVNFITPNTVDGDIYERCLWRIGVFQHAIGGNEEILGEITQELHDIAQSFDLTSEEKSKRLQQLADNSIRQMQEEERLEAREADLFGLNIPNQSWKKEIEAAENHWLSPLTLQNCIVNYLTQLTGDSHAHLLGEKSLKTLRLSQDARKLLLDDFKKLPRTSDQLSRLWEKWLKGNLATLSVTFEQDCAAENPETVHLYVNHPLIRQAAYKFKTNQSAYVVLRVSSNLLEKGDYPFAIYRWTKQGIKANEVLVPVAMSSLLETHLFDLLQTAESNSIANIPSATICEEIDSQHHRQWVQAQKLHIDKNRQYVDYKIQSLTASHQARCQIIEDQISRATNDKIRLMKQSELNRAQIDFDHHLSELTQAAKSGDIHATSILFGTIVII